MIIVGAGIGGLTLPLTLHRAGNDAHETAPVSLVESSRESTGKLQAFQS